MYSHFQQFDVHNDIFKAFKNWKFEKIPCRANMGSPLDNFDVQVYKELEFENFPCETIITSL